MGRLIDADKLLEEYDRVHVGPPGGARKLIEDAPTVGGWEEADKRPPEKGWYLVWKVYRFTPDHYGDPDGYWKMDILHWDEKYGWSFEKVKYWMPLPEPPKEG